MEKDSLVRVSELFKEYAPELADKVLRLAMAGDVGALRLCFDILLKLDSRHD